MPFHLFAALITGVIALAGLTVWAAFALGGPQALALLAPVTVLAAYLIRRKPKHRRHDPAQ